MLHIVNSFSGACRNTSNLCHNFNSLGCALRILGLRLASPKSQGASSSVLDVTVPCPRVPVPGFLLSGSYVQGPRASEPQGSGSRVPESQVPDLWVPIVRVSGSWVSRSRGRGSWALGLRVPRPISQVLILDYAFVELPQQILTNYVDIS